MKKMFVCTLCVLLMVMSVTTALADITPLETELTIPAAEAMETLVERLKADERVTEVWVPLLPEEYRVKSLSVNNSGSYQFEYATTHQAEQDETLVVQRIGFVNRQNTRALFSPYQMLMETKGVDSLSITQETVYGIADGEQSVSQGLKNGREYHNIFTAYGNETFRGFAQYNHCPVGVVLWDYEHKITGISEAHVPDYRHEMVVGLTDSMMVSMQYNIVGRSWSEMTLSELIPTVFEATGITFTTMGDANLNGEVNAVDALLMLQTAVGQGEITNREAFALADFDSNGLLNAKDALRTLQKAVGK